MKKGIFIILLCTVLTISFSNGTINEKAKNTFIDLQSKYTLEGNQENQPYWVMGAMMAAFGWMLTLYQIEKRKKVR